MARTYHGLICKGCGEKFWHIRRDRKYCSKRCSSPINGLKNKGKGRKKEKCIVCNEEFEWQGRIRKDKDGKTYRSSQLCCSFKCRAIYTITTRPENKQSRQYYRNRRNRLNAVEHELFKNIEIFERDNWRCHICGKRVNPKLKSPHLMSGALDHIISLIDGGSHTRKNVALAHKRCNSKKGIGISIGGDQLRIFG